MPPSALAQLVELVSGPTALFSLHLVDLEEVLLDVGACRSDVAEEAR